MDRVIASLMVWYGTHRRGTNRGRTPATYSLPFTEVIFPSASGPSTQIFGWVVPADRPKGLVLLCHGIDSAAHAMLPKAAMLRRHGYSSLLFDFRGTGRSTGDFVTLGYREAEDVLGAIAYLESAEELRNLPVFAIGESMGGSAVIRAAAESERISALVSESTYATLSDALRQRLKVTGPFAPQIARHCERISAERYDIDIADVSPERDIARISGRPLLIIHDNLDVLCTRAETDRLFCAAHAPKERWDVPYAPHTFAFMVAPREYERRVVDFLDRAVELHTRNRLDARAAAV